MPAAYWRPKIRLWVAERAGVGGPFAKAGGNHVGDYPADIDLLRRVVVGTGMVAGDSHGPGLMTGMQTGQEACGVVDILPGVEHVLDAAEMRGMVAVIDLHAAEINQCLAFPPGALEGGKRFRAASREDRFSFYIQGVRLKAPFLSGLRQTNGIENAGGHAVAVGGTQDLGLARVGGGDGTRGQAR